MKYTTKSGLELPPEVVEVIEQEQARQKLHKNDFEITNYGFFWNHTANSKVWSDIYFYDDFTEFYKLYPKKEVQKDLDSYGNEIVKGDKCDFSDYDCGFSTGDLGAEFICMHKGQYVACSSEDGDIYGWKFCRKITEKQSLKSELQSQMNELLKQAKEIEAKINEL